MNSKTTWSFLSFSLEFFLGNIFFDPLLKISKRKKFNLKKIRQEIFFFQKIKKSFKLLIRVHSKMNLFESFSQPPKTNWAKPARREFFFQSKKLKQKAAWVFNRKILFSLRAGIIDSSLHERARKGWTRMISSLSGSWRPGGHLFLDFDVGLKRRKV